MAKVPGENKCGVFAALYRYFYYKVIIPIKRERRGPEYIARGTAVGIFFGLTPMVWQMNMVLIFWVVMKYFKWNFSLPIGLAWTWISNTVTNIPLLYLYYITGRFMLGNPDHGGYDSFMSYFAGGILEGMKIIVKKWGGSILLGSIVYMTAGAAIGYIISYRYAKYRRNKKDEKNERRRRAKRAGSAPE